MKFFLKFALALAMVFAFAGSAFAMPNPHEVEATFKSLKEQYNINEKIKFMVEISTSGEPDLNSIKFSTLLGSGYIQNVKTVKSGQYKYTTTGYFTTLQEGNYMILFGVKVNSGEWSENTGTATAMFKVVNPNKIELNVTPGLAHVKKGEEVPILITYTSKQTPKFNVDSPKFTQVYHKKVNGVYKKLILYKVGNVATNVAIDVTAETKYDTQTKIIKIIVE